MPKNILVRNVPESVHKWIEDERYRQRLTQREIVLKVLEGAVSGRVEIANVCHPTTIPCDGEIPFSFIDLFSGIGGMRLGLQKAGGRCIFSCEWDRYAQKTYTSWFNDSPVGDIRKINPATIPDHDVLAAGWPCQPFSLAGVSKKNSLGRPHGFKDVTQGTLFFYLATIAEVKRPPVMILENVKNLMSHDKGRTWQTIYSTLDALRYRVFHKIIDAKYYVPQHRERIFIVCFDKDVFGDDIPFEFPAPPGKPKRLRDILEKHPDPRYTLSDHLWKYLQDYAERHRLKGNGFGFGLADLNGITRTLSARYHKDGSEILIPQNGHNPRRLTPKECAKLMGFEGLPIVVSDTQAYRQFGNALVPAIAYAVALQVVKVLRWYCGNKGNGCFLKGRVTTIKSNIGKMDKLYAVSAS